MGYRRFVVLDQDYAQELVKRLRSEDTLLWVVLTRLAAALTEGNRVLGTQAEVSEASGVSRPTFRKHVRRLEELGLARYRTDRRWVEIDPRLAFKGSDNARKRAVQEWAAWRQDALRSMAVERARGLGR